jgi:hypothetical protein
MKCTFAINLGERPDTIEVFYRTQKYADQGRLWFQAVAGRIVKFGRREIYGPKEIANNKRAGYHSPPSSRAQLPWYPPPAPPSETAPSITPS